MVGSGLSGSGSSYQQHLFTSQLLRLSTFGKKETRIAEQVQALETVLSSFGSAKSLLNPSASRHSTFLELHFSATGRLAGAKVLAFGLDKSRVRKLAKEERTYHAFYQLLAGATNEERTALSLLDDYTSYSLFQTSGCYHLPAGPGSDDSIAFDELRAAMKVLGFKPRYISAIFRLLSAILLLGNITFEDRGERDLSSESAWVANRETLDAAAELLGISATDLERGLTNRVRWVRKEMCAVILNAEGSAQQRDSLNASLYSILFAFIVETANHKVFPGDEVVAELQSQGGSSIIQLDAPGFNSRVQDRPGAGALLRALNGFDEFQVNYQNEVVQFWLTEHEFDGDAGIAARAQEDGVRLADVIPPDGSARIELLRGGRVGGKADRKPGGLLGGLSKTCSSVRRGASAEEADAELLKGLRAHFGTHTAFVSQPGGPGARSAFGISHYAGVVAYDASGFVEHDLDALDPEFVALFRSSNDGFISKLFSGPSLAAEVHPLDDNIIVAAQVSNQPLRRPTPVKSSPAVTPSDVDFTAPLLDPLEIHPLSSQTNATLSLLINLLDRTHVWSVISLRPNDSGQAGTVDTRRLRAQVSAFLLPELVARKKVDFITDVDHELFCQRHGIAGAGPAPSAVQDFLTSLGLGQPGDFALGNHRVWLSYHAWRIVEDRLRANEPPETRRAPEADGEGNLVRPSDQSFRPGFSASHSTFGGDWAAEPGTPGYGATDSADDLLLGGGGTPNPYGQRRGSNSYGAQSDYLSAPTRYVQASREQSDVWGSDKEAPAGFAPRRTKEGVIGADGMPQEGPDVLVEEVPASRGRRTWVIMVWALTWWIPSICLKYLGRMKRPDVRMAWREKVSALLLLSSEPMLTGVLPQVALCMLIGLFCGVVIFCESILQRSRLRADFLPCWQTSSSSASSSVPTTTRRGTRRKSASTRGRPITGCRCEATSTT